MIPYNPWFLTCQKKQKTEPDLSNPEWAAAVSLNSQSVRNRNHHVRKWYFQKNKDAFKKVSTRFEATRWSSRSACSLLRWWMLDTTASMTFVIKMSNYPASPRTIEIGISCPLCLDVYLIYAHAKHCMEPCYARKEFGSGYPEVTMPCVDRLAQPKWCAPRKRSKAAIRQDFFFFGRFWHKREHNCLTYIRHSFTTIRSPPCLYHAKLGPPIFRKKRATWYLIVTTTTTR